MLDAVGKTTQICGVFFVSGGEGAPAARFFALGTGADPPIHAKPSDSERHGSLGAGRTALAFEEGQAR